MEYRTALITGASDGLGAVMARRLASRGVTVVLCARRENELASVATDIRAAGGRACVRTMDVSNHDAAVEAVRAADEEVGGLDLVIANAGVGDLFSRAPSWERIRATCHVNFTGAIATLTAVLPKMVERRRGHLVGISSVAAFAPLPGAAGYGASKAGLTMFIKCLQLDLQGTGVHATAIHPGFIRTAMTARNRFPMPFLIDPGEAVDRILSRLEQHPARIDFPFPTAAAARIAGALPSSLTSMVVSRATRRR